MLKFYDDIIYKIILIKKILLKIGRKLGIYFFWGVKIEKGKH